MLVRTSVSHLDLHGQGCSRGYTVVYAVYPVRNVVFFYCILSSLFTTAPLCMVLIKSTHDRYLLLFTVKVVLRCNQ